MSSPGLRIAPLDLRRDLGAYRALQGRVLAPHRRHAAPAARAQLADPARGRGEQVVTAWRGDRMTGLAAWVALGAADDGAFYGSPVLAEDEASAAPLLARLVGEARDAGADWVQVSCWDEEAAKRRALDAAGFRETERFHRLERTREAGPAGAEGSLGALRRLEPERIDPGRFAALHNRCFAGVASAPPIDADVAAGAWRAPTLWREPSGVWLDREGGHVCYLILSRGGTIEEIGVAPEARRSGLGRALLARAIAAADAAGLPRLDALVAGSNRGSLALHRELGFVSAEALAVHRRPLG